jgi:menaquinone-dependent protoporphyrinogen oxidase
MNEETKRVLVSAGSKHGSTIEIAEKIGEALRGRGYEVDVTPPEEVVGLASYDVVVLGSAVYAGHWTTSAIELAGRVAERRENLAIWLFSSGPIGDPPKPEEDPVDVSEISESTGARAHHVFSRKIDTSKLSFAEKAILIAVRAAEGDFRDWAEIESWATDIADQLVKETSTR